MCKLGVGKIYLTRGGYFAKVISVDRDIAEVIHFHFDRRGKFYSDSSNMLTRTNNADDGMWSSLSTRRQSDMDVLWETKALGIMWGSEDDFIY